MLYHLKIIFGVKDLKEHLLKKIINDFEKVNITVVGDFILDGYYWGEVERISPEAPVPVLKLDRKEYRLGGAGNVAFNLLKLGCKTNLISFIGNDSEGEKSLFYIEKCGIKQKNMLRFKNKKTISKIRLMSERQQLSRIDIESDEKICSLEEDTLINSFKNSYFDKDYKNGVILSDYNKGVLTSEICQKIINICYENSIPVVIDPKGKNWEKYRNATLIKPNYKEFKEYFLNKNLSFEELPKYMEKLKKELNIKNVLVTLGSKGMAGLDSNNNYYFLPTSASEVYDVSGAGDTVASIITSTLCLTSNLENAMLLSNKGAGVVVSRIGTSACSKNDLLDCFKGYKSKVSDLNMLKEMLQGMRDKKRKVVYTSGNFDFFHAGHILFLQESSKRGDLLIVGVNSDQLIFDIKGDNRPLLRIESRIRLISSLECVDYIIICDKNTNKRVLKMLEPDDIITHGKSARNKNFIIDTEKCNLSSKVEIIDIKDSLIIDDILRMVKT